MLAKVMERFRVQSWFHHPLCARVAVGACGENLHI
jgi:hypothetical protein